MPVKTVPALLAAAVLALSPAGAAAQPLPGDRLIVPGSRIGAAELEQADQGAMVRELGEPNQTDQRGDRAIYRYGEPGPDGGPPDELVVNFDLAKDAPFEISTASPAYHTQGGLGVGSAAAAVRARLGPPLCAGGEEGGAGLLVYDAIWFQTSRGIVARVFIRKHLDAGDFRTGPLHC